jgi:hypothetical protein
MVARELGEVIGRDNNESEGQAAPVMRSGRSKIKTWDRRTIATLSFSARRRYVDGRA